MNNQDDAENEYKVVPLHNERPSPQTMNNDNGAYSNADILFCLCFGFCTCYCCYPPQQRMAIRNQCTQPVSFNCIINCLATVINGCRTLACCGHYEYSKTSKVVINKDKISTQEIEKSRLFCCTTETSSENHNLCCKFEQKCCGFNGEVSTECFCQPVISCCKTVSGCCEECGNEFLECLCCLSCNDGP